MPSSSSAPDATEPSTPTHDVSPVGLRRSARARTRGKAAPLAKIGMAVFAVGLIAVFVDMILFAAGSRNLPLWINLTAMLAPVGLGLGLIGVFLENRHRTPALIVGHEL